MKNTAKELVDKAKELEKYIYDTGVEKFNYRILDLVNNVIRNLDGKQIVRPLEVAND